MQILDLQVPHRAVAIGHEDVVGASLDRPFNGGVGVAYHQLAATVILRLARSHHIGVNDATDSFDIDRNVDLHELPLLHVNDVPGLYLTGFSRRAC